MKSLPRYRRSAWLPVCLLLLPLLAGCRAETAQDFEVVQFDGELFRLSQQSDEGVVVINFWYPSCPPCREEMPEFQRAWETLESGPVRFLGLFVPRGFDSEQDAKDFVDELGLTFPFATDVRARIAEAYEVEVYPTTYFIDRGGRLAATHASALTAERIIELVRQLSGEKRPG